MKYATIKKHVWMVAFVVIVATCQVLADPPSGGDFVIRNQTVEGGGGLKESAEFKLRGTVGQYEPFTSSNGAFTIHGGYWVDSAPSDRIFRDEFE